MKITSLGAGNMASAIIKSVISSKRVKAEDITVYDIIKDKYDSFLQLGVNCAETTEEAVNASEVILLAVKPQDYEGLLHNIKGYVAEKKKLFITIAAGISTEYICRTLEGDFPVVRVMPNTPLMIGSGATAISKNSFVDERMYTKICGLFAASGTVTSLDESLMTPVISVNSSSPAYVYLFAKAMIDNAVSQGLEYDTAKELVYKTILGSAEMLIRSPMTPEELIKIVASPKGTTEAALKVLYSEDFCKTVSDAMNACTDRANEISK